jgi:hypothetical protein
VENELQVITAVPGATPVTTPEPETLAQKGLLLLQEPAMLVVSVMVLDTQTVDRPVITGGGSTLMITEDLQPLVSV